MGVLTSICYLDCLFVIDYFEFVIRNDFVATVVKAGYFLIYRCIEY